MITGLPGTGKTTFARSLAEALGEPHFNTDIIRDELGLRGQYDEATKKKVYSSLLDHTRREVERGNKVVVDGTFFKKELRRPFVELSQQLETSICWVEITAEEPVVKERVSQKRTYSEADYDVYLKIKEAFEPLEEDHLTLRSDQCTVEEMIEKTKSYYALTV